MIQHPFAIFHKICINKNMKTTTNGPHSITRINENFYLFIWGGGWVERMWTVHTKKNIR